MSMESRRSLGMGIIIRERQKMKVLDTRKILAGHTGKGSEGSKDVYLMK